MPPGLRTDLGPLLQYWVVGGSAPGLIGPLDLAGIWWAGFPGVEPGYGAAHASELVTSLIGAPAEHEILATDPWTARMLVADTFAAGRVYLVGESAHVNPPWGGHGFNTSVGDAVNIAWKIAAVEQGWAGPALLASYEPERRGVVEQTVASAESNLRALAGDLPADALAIQQAKRPEFYRPRPGPRLQLRGFARNPAGCPPSTARRHHHLHSRCRSGRAPAARLAP